MSLHLALITARERDSSAYRWSQEDGLIVINVIQCHLEGLHGLIRRLALVTCHDDQLQEEHICNFGHTLAF